ncbi:hypothetical protein QVD17_36160 [Tagetes erecta]|uniref:BED-type domain-containing protein n=1 Tax=Tagetes erecta TaxID=13708 RepID=A0AAD8JVT5_TARER|nr:hypothetical protein QVD17_36160 [Tagetes erecta]
METSSSKTPVVDVDEKNDKEPVINLDEETVEKKSKYRSWVWDHMTIDKETKKVRCSYCKSVFAGDSKRNGTSHLGNHLKTACPRSPVYKKVDKKKQSTLSFKPKSLGESSLTSHILHDVDFEYRSYFPSQVEDGEETTKKRKRSERVVGAPKTEDWENASFGSTKQNVISVGLNSREPIGQVGLSGLFGKWAGHK